jgi:hypothetical protein
VTATKHVTLWSTKHVTLWCDVVGCSEWALFDSLSEWAADARRSACRDGWRVGVDGGRPRDVCIRHEGPWSALVFKEVRPGGC